MSVLLTGLHDELTELLAARLADQGDEVRLALATDADPERWRALRIHVALGDLADDDFIWRACTNVRTVVVGEHAPAHTGEVRDTLAAHVAKADPDRLVLVGAGDPDVLVAGARDQDISYVVLRFRKRGMLGFRGAVSAGDLAVAIDAADDLAGEPRLDLELWRPEAWLELKLQPPERYS